MEKWPYERLQDHRAWSASVRDVGNFIGEADSTRPMSTPPQGQVSTCKYIAMLSILWDTLACLGKGRMQVSVFEKGEFSSLPCRYVLTKVSEFLNQPMG